MDFLCYFFPNYFALSQLQNVNSKAAKEKWLSRKSWTAILKNINRKIMRFLLLQEFLVFQQQLQEQLGLS